MNLNTSVNINIKMKIDKKGKKKIYHAKTLEDVMYFLQYAKKDDVIAFQVKGDKNA